MNDWARLVKDVENEYVKQARESGQKIVGYACLATPREIFDAAGVFPYRLKALSNANTEMADAYMSRFNCGFCRSCLQLGLEGAYDFLDGLVETNGCDHLRGMFENWQYTRPRSFFHYLRVPHLTDPDSVQWFIEELELTREALAGFTGAEISEDSLAEAISRQERIAGKLREIYSSRWSDPVKIKGSEVMALMVLEGSVPPEVFEKIVDDVLKALSSRPGLPTRARLFMGGSATDEIALIDELESLGGLVVADSFCFGGRIFRETVPGDNVIERLAKTYLYNLRCPRMFEQYARRKDFIVDMIKRSKADGAVFFHNKFCDLHGIENVKLRIDLEQEGIPVLLLEKEYGAQADIGRLKTRLQAFLERIKR
ncbi:MAG: 2-hydroxyacyl-CoA dehydratase family protein [Dethiobacteria bacterium]|jgi:benzoyl-CoA reductase/2-hydroxyglutaryl-CoA dehydratase subunit BcrC/BadD/HgdB|nr:2-hydroxyacyl-CoA dehydratase [Bacillota bacterium]